MRPGAFASAEFRRPFDLTRAPLARASLLRLGEDDHAVVLTMHHLITDGWSFGVAAERAGDALRSRSAGPAIVTAGPADPVRRFRALAAQPARERSLDGADRMPGGPARRRARCSSCRRTARVRRSARAGSPASTCALAANCRRRSAPSRRREGMTPFMTLLAAYQLVLSRWSGQDDFAVGAPVANRSRPETERLIGYFVNMVALRTDLSGNPTVREFLARVREVALEAFENQEVPLEVLVSALGPRRDASRSPLFQVMFVLQNNALPAADPLDLAFSPLDIDQGTGTSKFDLSLGFEDFARRVYMARSSSTSICSSPRPSSSSRTST